MKLDKAQQLFFGCKIDSKLREALAQAKPGDRRYFEDADPQFLCICNVGEERWIGKVIKAGLNVTEVDDIQRNITSILRRIAPNMRHSPTAVKIYVLSDAVETEIAEEPERERERERGPYIANY